MSRFPRPRHVARVLLLFVIVSFATAPARAVAVDTAQLLSTRLVWNAAPYNSFTDLALYNGEMYMVFREGSQNSQSVPPAGQQGGEIRVLQSSNGTSWTSAQLLDFGINNDLRDPKLSVTPDGRLMVLATDVPQVSGVAEQSFAWFYNGSSWSSPTSAGDLGRWMWRVTWDGSTAYGVSYSDGSTRLSSSTDGTTFTTVVPTWTSDDTNESAMVFRSDGSAVAIVRSDSGNALIGTTGGNFSDWTWTTSNFFVGGPDMIQLPDGQIIVAGRFTDESVDHTVLASLDPTTGLLTKLLTLPSSGDTGYPGLLWYQDKLWVSYYGSQTGQADIYLSTVSFGQVPEPGGTLLTVTGSIVGLGLRRRRRIAS